MSVEETILEVTIDQWFAAIDEWDSCDLDSFHYDRARLIETVRLGNQLKEAGNNLFKAIRLNQNLSSTQSKIKENK